MWTTNRDALRQLIEDAREEFRQALRSRTTVYSVEQGDWPSWVLVGSRPVRPPSSVVLQAGQYDAVLADCKDFLKSEEWYAARGIPYRRGYLLYGPPGTFEKSIEDRRHTFGCWIAQLLVVCHYQIDDGTGKTSLVTCLAGQLGLAIYVLTLASPTMTDETLRQLLNEANPKSILLLEDVDAAFTQRTNNEGSQLTFSGLLNAIDGVAAQEGRLLFLTTNHIERLSQALIRPGRVDMSVEFDYSTKEQARQLFVSFYRDLEMQMVGQLTQANVVVGDQVIQKLGEDQNGTSSWEGYNLEVEWDKVEPQILQSKKLDFELMQKPQQQSQQGNGLAENQDTSMPPNDKDIDVAECKTPEQSLYNQTSLGGIVGAVDRVNAHNQKRSCTKEVAVDWEGQLQVLADKFVRFIDSGNYSMAQLQGFLMKYKGDPWKAVVEAKCVGITARVSEKTKGQAN